MRGRAAAATSPVAYYIVAALIITLIFLFIRSVRAIMLNPPIYLEEYATALYKKITDIVGTARHDFISRECITNTMLFPYKDTCKGALFRLSLWQWNELHVSSDYQLLETFLSKRKPSNIMIETLLHDEYLYPVPKEVKASQNVSLDDVYRKRPAIGDKEDSEIQAKALKTLDDSIAAHDGKEPFDLYAIVLKYFDALNFGSTPCLSSSDDVKEEGDSLIRKSHECHDVLSAWEIRRRAGVLDYWDPAPTCAPLKEALHAIAASDGTDTKEKIDSKELPESRFILGLRDLMSKDARGLGSDDCIAYLRMYLSNSDRMAAVAVWFLLEVSLREDIYYSLQRNIDAFIASGKEFRGSSLFHRDIYDPLMLFRCCFLESLRLHPPTADGVFFTTTDNVTAGDHTIYKNSVVNFPYYSILRSLWMEDPGDFMPRRWTDAHHQYDTLRHVFGMLFEDDEAKHPAQMAAIDQIVDLVLHFIHTYDFRFNSVSPTSLHVLKPTKAFVKADRRIHKIQKKS